MKRNALIITFISCSWARGLAAQPFAKSKEFRRWYLLDASKASKSAALRMERVTGSKQPFAKRLAKKWVSSLRSSSPHQKGWWKSGRAHFF